MSIVNTPKGKSILSNTISGVSANILQNIFLGAFFIILTKSIGLNKFSEYIIGNAIYQIVGAFSTMGLANYFIREYVQNKKEDYSTINFFGTELILSLVGFILIVILSFTLYDDNLFIIQVTTILGINILFDNLIYCVKAIHIAEKTQLAFLKITLFESLIKLLLAILFYYIPFNFMLFILLLVGARIFTLLLSYHSMPLVIKNELSKFIQFNSISKAIKFNKIKRLIYEGRIFVIIGAVNIIFWRINSLLLSKFASKADVGLYEIAYKFFSIAQILPVILLGTIYPILSKNYSNRISYLSIAKKTFQQILLFSVYTTLFAYFLCPYFIDLFFGTEYSGAKKLTQHMFFALIPFSLSLVQAYILLSSNNEKIDMWLNIFNVLLNTILAFLLIKFIGSLGSVTAITISFILFYILQSIILKRKKIDFLQNIKIEVTILISLVLITLLISEYSIFPKIPAPILLTISIAIISTYARIKGILNINIFIKK
jgi:O-antigen/teichoic acid export membrane protein